MRVLVLVVLGLLSVSGVGAQADLPPYIHYFDHLRGGLVIERADGTDSRMIADVPMDAGPPVWSASGKWMVAGGEIWSTRGDRHMPIPAPFVVSAYENKLLWSPVDELLLIVTKDFSTHTIRARIFDVEAEVIRNEFIFQDIYSMDWELYGSYWSPDGQRAFFAWWHYLVTIPLDGGSQVRSGDRQEPQNISQGFQGGRLFYVNWWSGDRYYMIEDIVSGRSITVGEASHMNGKYTIRWSPTLEHALVYALPCVGNCLKLVDWESGEVRDIALDARIEALDRDCYSYSSCEALWSPNGRYALLTNKTGDLYILASDTGETRPIAARSEIENYQWSLNEQLYFADMNDKTLSVYDPDTNESKTVELPAGLGLRGLSPSPDGRYIGLPTQQPMVIDETGAVMVQTFPHSHSTGTSCCPADYQWDSSGYWVMADYRPPTPHAMVLFNIDGTMRRELPSSGYSGFLPERAVPYLSPGQAVSVKKEPIFILPQDGRVQAVGWHPTDPNLLVTYAPATGMVFWSLAGNRPEIFDYRESALPYTDTFPVGAPLFWVPVQDTIAFYDGNALQRIDLKTSAWRQVEGVEYPILAGSPDAPTIQFSISDDVVALETDVHFGRLRILTSDHTGFVVTEDDDYEVSAFFVEVVTGRVVELEMPDDRFVPYAANAHGKLCPASALAGPHEVLD
jgi:hypothetical protein